MALLLGACSAPSKVIKVFEDPAYSGTKYSNILVIVVATNYESRSQFERSMASSLSSPGTSAAAYYAVTGGNDPVTKDAVLEVVRANGFDSVLVTSVVSLESDVSTTSGSPVTKVTRRDDTPVDFFRYDYEELNEPGTISISSKVVLSTSLYSAKDEKKIWTIESTNSGVTEVSDLISDVVEKTVSQLRKDNLIAR